MQRLKIEVFERWLNDEQKNNVLLNFLGSSELQHLIDDVTQDFFQTTVAKLDELFELYETFDKKFICSELGPMSFLWNSFIEMVKILLDFIKSTHTAITHASIWTYAKMVLCLRSSQLFATFHLLLATQQNIKETHPKIYDQFMVGNFSVKRTDESLTNCHKIKW